MCCTDNMRHENLRYKSSEASVHFYRPQNEKQGDHIHTYEFYPLNEKTDKMEHGGRGGHSTLMASYIAFEYGSYSGPEQSSLAKVFKKQFRDGRTRSTQYQLGSLEQSQPVFRRPVAGRSGSIQTSSRQSEHKNVDELYGHTHPCNRSKKAYRVVRRRGSYIS
jgi:hypothetical protein